MERRSFLKIAGKISLYSTFASFAGCEYFTNYFNPLFVNQKVRSDAEEIHPQNSFRKWWSEIEECSGFHGNFNQIHWFHVKMEYIPCKNDATDLCSGLWVSPHNIYLPDAVITRLNFQSLSVNDYYNAERVIKHEMLHDLIQSPEHPPIFKNCHVLEGI